MVDSLRLQSAYSGFKLIHCTQMNTHAERERDRERQRDRETDRNRERERECQRKSADSIREMTHIPST
jgi:hypothetical protein